MNPYPRTLQEAAERASTHELLQGRVNAAFTTWVVAAKGSTMVNAINAMKESEVAKATNSAKVILSVINTLNETAT